jgi:hypothetical protein
MKMKTLPKITGSTVSIILVLLLCVSGLAFAEGGQVQGTDLPGNTLGETNTLGVPTDGAYQIHQVLDPADTPVEAQVGPGPAPEPPQNQKGQ